MKPRTPPAAMAGGVLLSFLRLNLSKEGEIMAKSELTVVWLCATI